LISDDQLINEILNTCDVCVNPDPPGVYNNQITTNKVMEYMALKKPIVQFDLMEGRFSSHDASLYASDTEDFSEKIIWLLDNEPVRKQMGEIGYKRVIDELSWNCEKEKLVNFYNEVVK
jgi:glycosyltransferase involved in cell wall biosynthesis